jgi:hypothetical protein
MELKVYYQEPGIVKSVAILVSNKEHYLLKVLESKRK